MKKEQTLSSWLVESILEDDATKIKKIVVIYPGRFQPMGKHHAEIYKWLQQKFSGADVYIATTNKVEIPKSPFDFADKKKIIKGYGINNVVQVKNPYIAEEILKKYNPETTAAIFVVGTKDMDEDPRFTIGTKKSGGKTYFQSYVANKDNMAGYTQHGYLLTAPHVSLNVPGYGEMSGTQIRKALGDKSIDDSKRRELFKSIFGFNSKSIYDLVTKKLLSLNEIMENFVISTNYANNINNVAINKTIHEATTSAAQGGNIVDIGPSMYDNTNERYKNRGQKEANRLGWEVVDYLIGNHTISQGLVVQQNSSRVSFHPISSADHFGDDIEMSNISSEIENNPAYIKWKNFIQHIATSSGMMLAKFVVESYEKNNNGMSEQSNKLIAEFLNKPYKKIISEGGAYGQDYTICEICGNRYKNITRNHLHHKHKTTLEEYVEKYPNSMITPTCCKSIGDDNPSRRPEFREWFTKNNPMKDKSIAERNGKNREGTKRPDLSDYNTNIKPAKMYAKGTWTHPNDKDAKIRYIEEVRNLSNSNFAKYYDVIPNAASGRDKYAYHLDHIISIHEGFKQNIPVEIISHYKNLRVIPAKENIRKNWHSGMSINELLDDIKHSYDNRILLTCGGAYGHMSHPFDDNNLTFGDFKNIIRNALQGTAEFKNVVEKTDGQNIMVTWKDKKLKAARNGGQIKNPISVSEIATMFDGRGDIKDAFVFAMMDLDAAISKLSEKDRNRIFDNGKNFMNLEILYPATKNVVDYDRAVLQFHGALVYDSNGQAIGEVKNSGSLLASMINKVNQSVQSHFNIIPPQILTIKKGLNFAENQAKFLAQLNKLQSTFNLKDSDTIGMYHQSWWSDFISKKADSMKYAITNDVLVGLVNRWAFFEKAFDVSTMKKTITNPEFLEWVLKFDKQDHKSQYKANITPFENIMLGVGAEVMKNAEGFLSASPDKAVQDIRKQLVSTIKSIRNSGDLSALEKMETQLKRIEAIGGFKQIVPSEGLVFKYKGNTYKFSGVFAPINNLLGLTKYSR